MNILHGISVIALCATYFFCAVEGQATCALAFEDGTALTDSQWGFGYTLDTIEDVTPAGTLLLNLTATNINLIRSSTSDSDSGYIFMEPALENGIFTLTLTDYFTQYEELETSTTMRMSVVFGCSVNNRTLELSQPITDTNNNYPEFQNAPYTYELPIPLPSGFSVQLFGEISARDIDLTNTLISFSLNSSDPNSSGFSASWLSQDTTDTKLHYAQLLTTALLSIDEDVTFQIYATDNGSPSLTSVTNITISVDEENSTPTSPAFTYPLYIADYSHLTIEEASGTLISFNQGDISLSQGVDSTLEYTIIDNIGTVELIGSARLPSLHHKIIDRQFRLVTTTYFEFSWGSLRSFDCIDVESLPKKTGYQENFGITISEDYSYISITLQNVTEALLAEKYVILTLTVTRSGAASTGVTILHIDLPGMISCTTTTESDTTVEPTTESITITSASTDVTESTTEECVCDCSTTITSATEDSTLTITSIGSEGTTTVNDGDDNTATTESVTITSTETTECPAVTQECVCTTTDLYDDATITTASSTDSDTSGTTTTTVTPSLSFSSSIYRFDKDATFTGVLMTQTAVATNAEGTIVYSATFDDEDLASRITINAETAELEVTAVVSPAIYTFQIMATIEELSLSASATVILVVSTLTECSGEIVFGYALQVIELEEESTHENILPLDDNGCNYTIYSQSPSQELFYISDNYLNSVAIDREASYFSEMSVAQVRVIIDASCPNETETVSDTTRSKRDTEYEVLTGNIVYERTRTILVVIITDINDNAPVWSSDTPTYIGFPGYDLSQVFHAPYVYQFSATDADIDDNANVTYTLPSGSDELFYIHNTEGSLYIQQGVYVEDGSQFTVIATDGLFETPKELTVRTLESSNVIVLFITGGVLQDVDEIVNELSNSTGYWISSMGAAVISESDVSTTRSLRSVSRRSTRVSDANTLLRIVLYGLENNEPVTSDTLVSDVESADLTWAVSDSATLESILTTTGTDASSMSTNGYWAAIIVLSVLLFLVLSAAGVVYFLFCRPRNATSIESDVSYENFEHRNSDGSTGPNFAKSVTLGESQDDPTESTDSPNADWISNQTINPDKIFFENNRTFNSLKGGNDGDLVFITRNDSTTEISPNPSKRKSVAFNTTVEEIEVARL